MAVPWKNPPVMIAVDPGVSGAMAVVRATSATTQGDQTTVHDLPMSRDTFLKTQSKCLHVVAFDNLLMDQLQSCPAGTPVVYVTEQMQSLGSRTPARTLLGLTEMAGTLETAVRMYCLYADYPLFIRRYQPRGWIRWMFPDSVKRSDRKDKAKQESLELARKLFPNNRDDLTRKKDHNRSEAFLLAMTGIAELSGLQILSALSTLRKLQAVWHLQHAVSHRAVITDIFGVWDSVAQPLRREIQKRKQYQPMIKELKQ